jgi:hypothetical protein
MPDPGYEPVVRFCHERAVDKHAFLSDNVPTRHLSQNRISSSTCRHDVLPFWRLSQQKTIFLRNEDNIILIVTKCFVKAFDVFAFGLIELP